MKKVANMCTNSVRTIRLADQWCTLRMTLPNGTSMTIRCTELQGSPGR